MRRDQRIRRIHVQQCNRDHDAIKIFCWSRVRAGLLSLLCCIHTRCHRFLWGYRFYFGIFCHCIPGWLIQRETLVHLEYQSVCFGHNLWAFLCMFIKLIWYLQPFTGQYVGTLCFSEGMQNNITYYLLQLQIWQWMTIDLVHLFNKCHLLYENENMKK